MRLGARALAWKRELREVLCVTLVFVKKSSANAPSKNARKLSHLDLGAGRLILDSVQARLVRMNGMRSYGRMTKRPHRIERGPDTSIDTDGEFPTDVPEYFFYLLFQAVRHRDLTFDVALKPVGLTLHRWRTLSIIRRLEACTMSELARYSTIDRTTLTRAVDHLVAEGLVTRTTPLKDRRQVTLALTAQGETIYMSAVNILIGYNRQALEGISLATRRELSRALQRVIRNVVPDKDQADDIISFGPADRARVMASGVRVFSDQDENGGR